MTVPIDKLLRMAEQIAANISVSDDPDVVAGEVLAHLQKFWDPRMRAAFVRDAGAHAGAMSPAVREVLARMAREQADR